MNLGLGKQVGGRFSSWSLFILKNGRKKTSAILDGSYVTEPSSVPMGGREEFTPKE